MAFYPLRPDSPRDVLLWQWFEALAHSGIHEENYFAGTDLPANALYMPSSDKNAPSVRYKSLKVTLTWKISRDGRIIIDGADSAVVETTQVLRRSHPPYVLNSPLGQHTGKYGCRPSNVGASACKRHKGQ